MKKLFYIFLILLFAVPAFATDYYVAQSSAGDGSGSSYANRMSISTFNALNTGYGGDTFYFSGTITSQIDPGDSFGGTSSSVRVTLDGYQAGAYNATDGNHTNLASLAELTLDSAYGTIELKGNDYITIQDFNFNGGDNDDIGILIWALTSSDPAEWITIKDSYFHEYVGQAIWIAHGDATWGGKYITIGGASGDGNELYDIASDTSKHMLRGAGSSEVIVSYNKVWNDDTARDYGSGGITVGDGKNSNTKWLIEYNYVAFNNHDVSVSTFLGAGEVGIGGKGGSEFIVRFNKVMSNQDNSQGAGHGAGYDSYKKYIYCNWFEDNWTGGGVQTGNDSYNHNGIDNEYIYYFSNIITKNNDSGIATYSWGADTDDMNYLWFFNNTIYGNAVQDFDATSTGLELNSRTLYTNISNNIFEDNRPNEAGDYRQMAVYDAYNKATYLTFENNRFYDPDGTATIDWGASGDVAASTVGTDNTVGDPGLTDPANGDFTISTTGSAVYGAGKDMRASSLAAIVIQGTTYTIRGDEGFTDDVDFSGSDPTAWTTTTNNRDDVGRWDQGAIIYGSGGAETDAPTPDPAEWTVEPAGDSIATMPMTATTGADVTPPIEYYFNEIGSGDADCIADGCADASYGTGGTDSGWQSADPTYTDDTLQLNKCYCFSVQMKDSLGNTGTVSAIKHGHTWAATPGASTLGGATDTTLTITEVDENSNTAGTWIAVQCTSSVPHDADWVNMWVNETTGAPLTPLDNDGWQAFETWDAEETVTGLNAGTEYCFKAKAINAASVETALGAEVCLSTTGTPVTPPDVSAIGVGLSGVKFD